MSEELWKRGEIESPCVKLCQIHPEARICVGCYRSIEEITGWGSMSPDERRDIMAALPARADALRQRRGGRARTRPGP